MNISLVKKFFAYHATMVVGLVGLLLTGCQSVPVDRKLDGYVLTSARNAEANRDYGAAAAHYASLYDASHPDAGMAVGMARNLRYAGRPEQAIRALEDALMQLKARPDLLIELGKQYIAAGKADLAVDLLRQAAELAPSNWEVAHALGIAHDRMGRFDEAWPYYERASALSPGNPRILNNLALSRAMAGDLDIAIQLLERAASLPSASTQVGRNLQLFAQVKMAKADALSE